MDIKNVEEAGLWGEEDRVTREIILGYAEFKL